MSAACASYAKIIEKFKSHFEGNSATAARTHARMGGRTHANKHTHTPTHIAPFLSRASGLQCFVSRWAAAHVPPWLHTWRNATQSTGVAATRYGRHGLAQREGRAAMQPGAALSAIYFAAAGESIAGLRCVRLVCSNDKGEMCALRRRLVLSVRSGYSQAPRLEARGW